MKHRLVVAGLVALFTAGGAAVAQSVSADPFGQWTPRTKELGEAPESGSIPDDLVHSYCFSDATHLDDDDRPVTVSLPPAARLTVHRQMQNLAAQTDYRVQYQARCDAKTDVVVKPSASSSAWGTWACDTFVAGTALCEQGTLQLDVAMLDPAFEQAYGFPGRDQFATTTCHEIGHSVGMAHGEGPGFDDCMQSGIPHPNPPRTYNAHHVAHANARTSTDR